MKKVLSVVLVLLNTLINEQASRPPEAAGLLEQIDFQFVFNLCLFHEILTLFKSASDFLQNVTSDISAANTLIRSIGLTVQNMRNDSISFEKIYVETEHVCIDNNIDIVQAKSGRRKKIPKKFENFFFTENVAHLENESVSEKDDFRLKIYIPSLDRIISELNNRFGNTSEILNGIDALHPKSQNFLDFEVLKNLATHEGLTTLQFWCTR